MYWRRRAVVIGVAVVVVVVMSMLLFGGGDGKSQEDPAPAPTASASPSPTPSPSDSASPTASPSVSGSPSTSPSAKASGPTCSDDDIEVAVTTDKQTYAAGENPKITMAIKNKSGTACVRDIGSGANTVTISSGGHHAWSSDDCEPGQVSNDQLLPAGGKAEATVTWERKLSAPGCSGEASAAQAGTYQVEASNGEVTSQPVRITLQ